MWLGTGTQTLHGPLPPSVGPKAQFATPPPKKKGLLTFLELQSLQLLELVDLKVLLYLKLFTHI